MAVSRSQRIDRFLRTGAYDAWLQQRTAERRHQFNAALAKRARDRLYRALRAAFVIAAPALLDSPHPNSTHARPSADPPPTDTVAIAELFGSGIVRPIGITIWIEHRTCSRGARC